MNDSLAASSGKGIYSIFMENSLGSAPQPHVTAFTQLHLWDPAPQQGWESSTCPSWDVFHGLGVGITHGRV